MMPLYFSRACFDLLGGRHEALAGRHERTAIEERPGVILDVRDLDAAGAAFDGELDHAWDVVDVLAVDRRIDGQRHARFLGPLRDFDFFGEAAFVGGDAVGVVS